MATPEPEIKAAFSVYAENGILSASKLQRAVVPIFGFTDQEVLSAHLKKIDLDDKASLTEDQFILLAKEMLQVQTDKLRESFEFYDKNHDGFISRKEFKDVMRKIGKDLIEEFIDNMFKEADLDHDGKINFREFIAMMNATNKV